ncbi:preprotein translocase subunit SecE [Diplocloster agilis]|uniref:Protein translocase subunit SecE n=1 Tax=Diplocloster agilis TaxID=2850323 RepID=A0A949K7R1_9FIRM|nr:MULTISPECIES: preprotein translocase subunit SecE [Lachnospiraceae]MBU9737242.1 preprotein translocase subunit SecE [Diplocloster agilis]MBU9746435.1 preprotein translocase subunit SecE [Diplocloster agilis]MCU6736162.1 preprotein translocase subunit SecE [Suonthocola fibrivorans]SCJ87153.1 preprotein translocase subunit SecE [uncultured Clostridium sp.]
MGDTANTENTAPAEKPVKTEKSDKKDKAPKKSWFKGLKAEFKKIIWPDKQSLMKQTAAVVSVSVVLGLVIAGLDLIIRYGVDFLVK